MGSEISTNSIIDMQMTLKKKTHTHTHRVYNWTNKGNIHLLYITSNAWHGTCKMIASNRFQDAAGNPRNAQESRRDSEGTQFHERYWERRKRDQSTQKVVVTELLNNNNRSSEMAHNTIECATVKLLSNNDRSSEMVHNTRMCHCETSKQ